MTITNEIEDTKHFLDTSVAQPMLMGPEQVKQYYKEHFGNDRLYISEYVQMEFRRSVIAPLIDFYMLLDMPPIQSLGDALATWSESFKPGALKAVLRLIGQIVDTHQLDGRDKEECLRVIGRIIKRIERSVGDRFVNIGENATRCARSRVHLVTTQTEQLPISDQFKEFIDQFNDVQSCRSRCRVDAFILSRSKAEIEAFIAHSETLEKPNHQDNKGFVGISENLQTISDKGGDACSCRMCGRIGDAIIALETPINMQLEHTDRSFNHLCDLLQKPHYQHPAAITIQNSYSSSASNENS